MEWVQCRLYKVNEMLEHEENIPELRAELIQACSGIDQAISSVDTLRESSHPTIEEKFAEAAGEVEYRHLIEAIERNNQMSEEELRWANETYVSPHTDD